MLHFSLWKQILVWGLCALGLVLAAPNAFYTRVEQHNDAVKAIEKGLPVTPELTAQRAGWPDWLPNNLVNLGLDLRGGAHLLGEVQLSDVYAQRMNALWPEVRDALRAERGTVGTIRRQDSAPDELRVRLSNPQAIQDAVAIVQKLAQPVVSLGSGPTTDLLVSGQNGEVVVKLSDAERAATDDRTIRQSLEIIRRRVDEVGTREPTIQRQGSDRILIQVPGIGSAEELKSLIGTTAQLTFNKV
ncbi:MAG: protein translocase subunit SecD, partial [Brevirhabdus sp.]